MKMAAPASKTWNYNGASQSRFRLNFLPSLFGPELNIMTAQSSGRIGINEDTPDNFASRLVVNGSTPDQDNFGLFVQNEFLAASYHRGKSYGIICSSADNTGGASYGVFSSANGSSAASANTFGLYGRSIASNNSQNVGVYGVVTGSGTNNYAGYFAGDVLVTGAFTSSSDRRLKKDIQIESKVMDKLMKVRPSTYEYRQDGKFSEMNLDEGAQHGFIAQELEEVFPELVKESVFTFGLPNSGESGDFQPSAGEPFDFKSVNYQAMIPILTKGIQEQQSTILDQKELILGLTEKVEQLEQIIVQSLGKQRNDFMNSTSKGNVLYQNSPNPFDVVTEIRYELAANIRSAEMIVFDMNGRQVRKFSNLSPGSGSIQLEGNQLESGMYLYSLLVDGQEIDTKRMILTE